SDFAVELLLNPFSIFRQQANFLPMRGQISTLLRDRWKTPRERRSCNRHEQAGKKDYDQGTRRGCRNFRGNRESGDERFVEAAPDQSRHGRTDTGAGPAARLPAESAGPGAQAQPVIAFGPYHPPSPQPVLCWLGRTFRT